MDWLREWGYAVQILPYREWLSEAIARIRQTPDNALYPYLAFLTEPSDQQMTVPEIYFQTNQLQFDCQNVLDGLRDSAIAYPAIDTELLTTYFSYFVHSGFLHAPQSCIHNL